jgi:hypothetical protein
MMELFVEAVGWKLIDPAAARANADFLAEYKTGEETPRNAGVSRAHAGHAVGGARKGLRALRRANWMAQYEKVAFIILTSGARPHHSWNPLEYKWLQRATRQALGLPDYQGDRADRASRIQYSTPTFFFFLGE